MCKYSDIIILKFVGLSLGACDRRLDQAEQQQAVTVG